MRWRWPPDNWDGRCSAHLVSPTRASSWSTRSRISGLGRLRMRSPKATFSRTVMWVNAA